MRSSVLLVALWGVTCSGCSSEAQLIKARCSLASAIKPKLKRLRAATRESAKAASGFGARAFTVGSDVHFGAGQYAPGTKEGHELTHVVQGKNAGIQRKAADDEKDGGREQDSAPEVSDPSEPAEKADSVADGVADSLHDEEKGGEKKGGEKKLAGKEADEKEAATGAKDEGSSSAPREAPPAKNPGASIKRSGICATSSIP